MKAVAKLIDFTVEKGFKAIRNVLSKYDVVFSILYLVKLQAGNDFTIYIYIERER